MTDDNGRRLDRRELLTRAVPACALGCLGLMRVTEALGASVGMQDQEIHKFDEPGEQRLSIRQLTRVRNSQLLEFIRNVREEMGDEELIRWLKVHSTAAGRQAGEQQAADAPDRTFGTFVSTFRPPRFARTLTHEVVEDTEDVFELRVTECVWASVFREAGLDGEIGHAAVCNMDYAWPRAFNPTFKMERSRTLMQGHDHCNHRYLRVVDSP